MVPVSCRHEQSVPVIQDHLVPFCQPQGRISVELQLIIPGVEIVLEIDKAEHFPGLAVKLTLLFEWEEEHPFTAAELGVPLLEYPALARSVFYTTRENQVIREELYVAVAAVLAFVLSLKRGESPPAPRVEVPMEVRFDADGNPEIVPETA